MQQLLKGSLSDVLHRSDYDYKGSFNPKIPKPVEIL